MVISYKEGKKDALGKVRLDLVLPEFIIGTAKCLTHGCDKYGANTWQNVKTPIEVHYAALMRHILIWRMGEKEDNQTGIHHLHHAASNMMFILDHEKEGRN